MKNFLEFSVNEDKEYNKEDIAFVQEMIIHHQAAIKMAEKIIQNGKNSQINSLALDIFKAQNKEISWMKKFLKDIGQLSESKEKMKMPKHG